MRRNLETWPKFTVGEKSKGYARFGRQGEQSHRSINMVCVSRYKRPQLEKAEVVHWRKDWIGRLGQIMESPQGDRALFS